MSAKDIIRQALEVGVVLYLREGKLAYKVKKGEFPADLKTSVRSFKDEIEKYLASLEMTDVAGARSAIPELTARHQDRSRLSFTQERFWAIDRLSGGSSYYNLSFAVEMNGDCCVEKLERAIETIVDRHQSLRTRFIEDGEETFQVVSDLPRFSLGRVDLSGLPPEDVEGEVSRRFAMEVEHVFDLRNDVLLHATLLKLTEQRHILLANMHHIVSDGWSISVLIKELNFLYTAYVNEDVDALPPLPVQYADYAEWQREVLTGVVLQNHLDYWLETLDGAPALHSLRTDKPRPPVFSFRGATVTNNISTDVVEGLQRVCKKSSATLFMALHAAFSVLLSRYSGATDIVIGTPVANREEPQIAGLIGCFINVLVLRYDLSGDATFMQLLAQARDRMINAMEHQALPFEVLVEHAQPARSLSHSPLFQVAMVYQNNQSEALDLPGMTLNELEYDTSSAKYDLTLVVKESNGSIRLSWEYATDLFEAETIRRMALNFDGLLEAILSSPDTLLQRLDFLHEDEHCKLIHWSTGNCEAPRDDHTVVTMFEAKVAAKPERTAVVFNGAAYSYGEVNRRANKLAHWLVSHQAGAETLVTLCVERSLDMVVGLLGILKAGAAYLPLDPDYPPARLQHMVSDSQSQLVVTQAGLLQRLALDEVGVLCIDTDEAIAELEAYPQSNPCVKPDSGDLAYVIYTSGSTGLPKGVQIEHGSLGNFLEAMRTKPGFAATDRLLAVTPISFDIHVLELFLPLVCGGTTVVCDRSSALDGHELLRLIDMENISVMQATPATWRLMLATEAWATGGKLKVLCGGEAMDRPLADELNQRAVSVWNMYGPTEATVWSSCAQVLEKGPIPIGRPLPNTQMYVLNTHNCIQPIGVAGEVLIGGAGVARGYIGRRELNSERFVEASVLRGNSRFYRTGDIGYWTADGELVCLGRLDNQIKIRGFRVELGEIEHQLLQVDSIKEATVISEGSAAEQRLVAYIVSTESGDNTEHLVADLRSELGKNLPEYMIPSVFIPLEQLPLTPNGKVDKNALVSPAAAAAPAYVPPTTPTEIDVAKVLSELLRLPEVSVEGDFFELGGHSLFGARMATTLNNKFDCNVSLKDIFALRTARNLALHIDYLSLLNTQEMNLQSPESVTLQEEVEW